MPSPLHAVSVVREVRHGASKLGILGRIALVARCEETAGPPNEPCPLSFRVHFRGLARKIYPGCLGKCDKKYSTRHVALDSVSMFQT